MRLFCGALALESSKTQELLLRLQIYPQEVLCCGIFELQRNNFFQCDTIYQSIHTSQTGAEIKLRSSKLRCIFLQSNTTEVFFIQSIILLSYIDFIEHFAHKIIQQVRSRSSEALRSAFEMFTLSFGNFFRLHRFYCFLMISIISDSFRLFRFFQ